MGIQQMLSHALWIPSRSWAKVLSQFLSKFQMIGMCRVSEVIHYYALEQENRFDLANLETMLYLSGNISLLQ
jgi:hypothetical protein